MAGVTLNGFDITAVQFEFVCNTGVSEAMKDHFGEKDGSDTAVCFGAFQNLNRGTAGTQWGKTSDDIFVFQGVQWSNIHRGQHIQESSR